MAETAKMQLEDGDFVVKKDRKRKLDRVNVMDHTEADLKRPNLPAISNDKLTVRRSVLVFSAYLIFSAHYIVRKWT